MPMEILAPAGSREALVAAVRCGADAVYLGVGDFNARRGAQNFAEDELKDLCAFCHVRGVKVYLTLNTLLGDAELPRAGAVVEQAAAAGVDAFIIQDLGLWAQLGQTCPDMPLHASTQMAVHNLAGVRQLEKMGFTRCVLARELSGEEIAAIAGHTSMELEVFVHGALCFSLSGGCYLSGMLGGRSGNRGLCAQPCRLPFACAGAAKNHANAHSLSLKDMSYIPRLPQLESLGIASAKIEGRMKRPEYVAAAVTGCRASLRGETPDMAALEAVFSRGGFTDGYWTGRRGPAMFGTRGKEDVLATSGVLAALEQLYKDEPQRIPVDFALTLGPNAPVRLTVSDDDGHRAEVMGDIPETAQNRPTDAELAARSLQKTGGTPYKVRHLRCDIAPGLMLPVSKLNALRAAALAALETARAAGHTKIYAAWPAPKPPQKSALPKAAAPRVRVQFALWPPEGEKTPAELPEALLTAADEWVLPADVWLQNPRWAAACGEKTAIASLPPALFGAEQNTARDQLLALQAIGVNRLLAGNLGTVELGRSLGFALHGDYGLNILNTAALAVAKEPLCLCDATLSFELHSGNFAAMSAGPLPVGAIVYGRLPLMTVRNCPLKGESCGNCPGHGAVTDRLGERFPVACFDRRISQLYNSRVLYLGDKPDLMKNLDFVTFYYTGESLRRCGEIVKLYAASAPAADLQEPFTRGLYQRKLS